MLKETESKKVWKHIMLCLNLVFASKPTHCTLGDDWLTANNDLLNGSCIDIALSTTTDKKKKNPEVHSARSLSALKLLFSVFHVLLQMVHWRLVGVQQDLWWRDAHKSRALHQEDWTVWGGNTGLQRLSNTPADGERVLQQPVMSTSVGSFGLVWSKEIWNCMFWDVLVIDTKAFNV